MVANGDPVHARVEAAEDNARRAYHVAVESRRLVQTTHEHVGQMRAELHELRDSVESLVRADMERQARDRTYERLARVATALFPVLVTLVAGLYWVIQHAK